MFQAHFGGRGATLAISHFVVSAVALRPLPMAHYKRRRTAGHKAIIKMKAWRRGKRIAKMLDFRHELAILTYAGQPRPERLDIFVF